MRKNDIIRILTIVFAVLIAALVIGGGIYLFTASKKIQALNLTPGFADTELGVVGEYTFTISATPAKAKLKKVKCKCDDPNSTFELTGDGKAVLRTGTTEGTVTVYVEYKDIKSNVLTFQVVDLVAQAEAQAAAEAAAKAEEEAAAAAEAEAQAAAEAAAAVKVYVKMIGDNVNVRSQNNTDCDVLGKAKKGETFEKVETVDDWTHIIYNGQDGYIKSEFLQEVSEDEMNSDGGETASTDNEETKKEDTKTPEQQAADAAAAAAKAEADAAAKAEAEAAAALQAQQEAMAAAAAAQAAAGFTINCADGPQQFTAQQYNFLKGFWAHTGDWEAYAHKHTKSELLLVCQIEGGIN